MSINIVYISCHESLEFDEVKLLSSFQDVTVRSIGAYSDPRQAPTLRPIIDTLEYSSDWLEWIAHYEPDQILDSRLMDWADAIIFMHKPERIHKSINVLKAYPHTPIYFRSIGQSSDSVEISLANYKRALGDRFKIIRYSPNERHFPNYVGSDALIRFYKNKYEFKGWQYFEDRPVLFALQGASSRGQFGHFDEVAFYTKDIPYNRLLIGPRNSDMEAFGFRTEQPSYEGFKEILRRSPLLVYAGMIPASYTLTFMEAMMTGTPIVSIDRNMWADEHKHWCPPEVFEVDELIPEECVVHKWEDLGPKVIELMSNPSKLARISHENRLNAETLFGENKIRSQWAKLLHI